MAMEWREAFCPMCGRTMGQKTVLQVPGKAWTKIGSVNRWEATAEFTGDKPFGVIKSSAGRGTMAMVRYYDIDEDVEGYFPLMRARLLAVLGEWLAKGWITREDVEQVLG